MVLMPFLESDHMFVPNGLTGNYFSSNVKMFWFITITSSIFHNWINSAFCVCRGFPVWLQHIPGIEFRTYNQPFMVIYYFVVIYNDDFSTFRFIRPVSICLFCFFFPTEQNEMKNFTTLIVDMVKKEKLFASQGGPIILAQVRTNIKLFSLLLFK